MESTKKDPQDNHLKSEDSEEELDESYHGIYGDSIKIKKSKLVSLLKCQLCCGIYRTPTTINECMHSNSFSFTFLSLIRLL